MEWMIMPLRRYADFQGRSRRLEYWMFVLGTTLFFFLMLMLTIMIGIGTRSGSGTSPVTGVFAVLFVLTMLALFIPTLAVIVRRFHDQDKSGWMVLLWFIPYVGGIVIFVFMCMDGTRGENSYGPDPKGDNQEALAEMFE
jgi:uncharacterized membrane protein YhaH (DUF805 family)